MGLDADEFVGRAAQLVGPVERRDGHSQHDTIGTMCPGDLTCHHRCRAGRDAVIDHDGCTAGERHPPPVASIQTRSTIKFGTFALLNDFEIPFADAGESHNLIVDHPGVVLADRPQSQLRLERHSQLADQDHIQRNIEGLGDLSRHRNPAAGRPRTTASAPRKCSSRSASLRPASTRFSNISTTSLSGERGHLVCCQIPVG